MLYKQRLKDILRHLTQNEDDTVLQMRRIVSIVAFDLVESDASGILASAIMARRLLNLADRVVRIRVREPIDFQTLTENRSIRLASVSEYTGRSHFAPWQRILAGAHDFANMTGIFTPLVYVEVETTDVACDPAAKVEVRGESWLARSLDESGAIRHLVRDGHHTVLDAGGTVLARTRMLNVFTRYDPDPRRRRVTTLPPEFGLGPYPSRITEVPGIESLVDLSREADFAESELHVWHYGQTDPNRHINGMAYLRVMEEYVADLLHASNHDLKRFFAARARIVYRKPCFRGEAYRRAAWFRSEAPLTLTGVFFKATDSPAYLPAVAIEMTLRQHGE